MNDRTMKRAIARVIAVSTVFFLGGVASVSAQNCSPASGDKNVAIADSLIQQNKPQQGYAYLNLAREQGSGEGYRYTAEMYEKGMGVQANASMARHMFSFGAQSNDSESMYRTASDYYERGLKKDGDLWAKRARSCGHMGAVMLLVKQAAQERRHEEARALLTEAIDAGHLPAKLYLAEVYDKGLLGLERDHQTAFRWYYLSAKEGNAKAMAAVGYYFVRGLHGIQDEVAAIHWYHEAAKAGHVESMTAYGWMLAVGKGGQVDLGEANHYFKKAAKHGDKQAAMFLKEFSVKSSAATGQKG